MCVHYKLFQLKVDVQKDKIVTAAHSGRSSGELIFIRGRLEGEKEADFKCVQEEPSLKVKLHDRHNKMEGEAACS